MGVYTRPDSKYYWLLLERPSAKPLREATKLPLDAPTPVARRLLKQQAEELYALRMTALARSDYALSTDAVPRTFAEQATWYETHKLPTQRGAAVYRMYLPRFRAHFGVLALEAVTPARVDEYVTARLTAKIGKTERTVKPRTVNREIDVLKEILQSAVPDHLAVSPIAGLKRLRVVKPKKRTLTTKEEARLLAVLEPEDRALYIVAVDTLMRLSNVVQLRRAEDRGDHLDLLDSKTGPYTVPLSRRARKALDALQKAGPYFFQRRRLVKQPRNGIRLMLKYACARCVPPIPYGRLAGGITFHTGTRATGATRMLQAGHDPRTVQEVGNWADFRAMQDYLTTTDALRREAVNSLGPITPHSRRRSDTRNRPVKSSRK